jgi:hypothetical protein
VPVDVEYSKPSRFRIRASGEVTLHEIEELYGTILSHPGLTPGSDAIVDCSEVALVPSARELREAARELRPILDHGLGAIGVVARDPYVYGMSRMFSVFAENIGASVGAFRTVDDANRWLAERRRDG